MIDQLAYFVTCFSNSDQPTVCKPHGTMSAWQQSASGVNLLRLMQTRYIAGVYYNLTTIYAVQGD